MNKRQPDFERLETALRVQESDRVPLFEVGVDREVKEAFLGRRVGDSHADGYDLQADVEFWTQAGYDFIFLYPDNLILRQARLDAENTASNTATAYGESSERKWAPEKTGAIASMEDFERYPWPEPQDIDYSIFDEVGSRLPEGMKVLAGLGGGPFIVSWHLMGFETFCIALSEDPELAEAVVNRVKSILDAVATTLAEYDCIGAVLLGDDIAYTEGLMFSPRFLRKYLFPWQKSKCEQFRKKGLPTLYHSDGDLEQVLEDILAVGFRGLHPIEPKAMDIRKLKKTIGPRICLLGNVDLGHTLTRGTPEEVRREARKRIEEIGPGGGYCLGSSNSVTNYVPLENYRAMIETVFEHGSYPLR